MSTPLYQPLKPNEFRLLKLSPDSGVFALPDLMEIILSIQCRHLGWISMRPGSSMHARFESEYSRLTPSYIMETFSTDNHPEYQALSYCWGESEPAQTIQLNQTHNLKIGPGLHHALRAFSIWEANSSPGWIWLDRKRTIKCPKWIWIDQICINQDDDSERSAQIGMMGDIYSRAEAVTVWLGRGHTIAPCLPLKKHLSQTSSLGFVGSPWYKRTWTIQEILLAKRARLVTDDDVRDWGFMMNIVEWRNITFSSISASKRFYQELIPFDDLRRCREQNDALRCDLELLNIVRQRECTEPRDKIYGILELISPEIREQITIDTKLDHGVVFWNFARAFLSHHGPDLFLLTSTALRQETRVQHDDPMPTRLLSGNTIPSCVAGSAMFGSSLPSWVPDFTLPARKAHTWSLYRAGRSFTGKAPEISLSKAADAIIHIPGLRMATVQSTTLGLWPIEDLTRRIDYVDHWRESPTVRRSSMMAWVMGKPSNTMGDYIAEIQFLMNRSGFPLPKPTCYSDYQEPALKLAITDDKNIYILPGGVLYPERQVEESDFGNAYHDMLMDITLDFELEDYTPSYHIVTSMLEALKGACWFTASVPGTDITVGGVGPEAMEEGDEVFIFFRGSAPIIMRPSEEGDGSYRVVGPAYVEEFMDGTAFEARKPLENYEMVTIR